MCWIQAEKLETQIMSGEQLAAAKIDAGEALAPTAQVVVIRFTPVKKGNQSGCGFLRPIRR